MFKAFLFVSILFIVSCKPSFKDRLVGGWIVEQYEYREGLMSKDSIALAANMMSFKDDNSCFMPGHLMFHKNKSKGEYKIIESYENSKGKIRINAPLFIYTDTFQVEFIRDSSRRMLIILMESDDIFIQGSKSLYDFDRDKAVGQ